ncbi:hypothetical protein [Neisseria wadsworthii]|uniref:Uncharacterized protein n=1 Tax=Neisseria wadsworthii 9715 TaxID=1030841 RepID=G4CSC5_9NEIS|nr:hypothetical protein [Neisseria wadsworthii]EGZ44741.1 hypothetical protein HMPREF9370_1985 [Neisseria wadsworthii 9715]QMT35620.1 hypothetical protein H3L96_11525 [Neisseria wadsworthii]
MAPEHILQIIRSLNVMLSRKLKAPFGVMAVYCADNRPEDTSSSGAYYLLDKNGITLFQDETVRAEYRLGQRSLLNFFLDHCPEEKRRQAAILLTYSPLFWRLKSALNIHAGTIPLGRLLQTTASTAALITLLLTWFFSHQTTPETKPVGIYMSICFTLALSSVARVGDWWDDVRTGINPGIDYARRLGLFLAALVPFYYYANITDSLLEKPLQYTLLSTTAAAVCMSFFSNRS